MHAVVVIDKQQFPKVIEMVVIKIDDHRFAIVQVSPTMKTHGTSEVKDINFEWISQGLAIHTR